MREGRQEGQIRLIWVGSRLCQDCFPSILVKSIINIIKKTIKSLDPKYFYQYLGTHVSIQWLSFLCIQNYYYCILTIIAWKKLMRPELAFLVDCIFIHLRPTLQLSKKNCIGCIRNDEYHECWWTMINKPFGQNLQNWLEGERFESWAQELWFSCSLLKLNTLWNRIMNILHYASDKCFEKWRSCWGSL